jgi:hypothetical protein
MTQPNKIIKELSGKRWNKLLQRACGRDIQIITELSKDLRNIQCDAKQFENSLFSMIFKMRNLLTDGGTVILKTENLLNTVTKSLSTGEVLPTGEFVTASLFTEDNDERLPDVANIHGLVDIVTAKKGVNIALYFAVA